MTTIKQGFHCIPFAQNYGATSSLWIIQDHEDYTIEKGKYVGKVLKEVHFSGDGVVHEGDVEAEIAVYKQMDNVNQYSNFIMRPIDYWVFMDHYQIYYSIMDKANCDLYEWIQMSCTHGTTFDQKSYQINGMSLYAVTTVLNHVCKALHYLHVNLQVVHNDVKPENVLVCMDPYTGTLTYKLTDFGASVFFHTENRNYQKKHLWGGTAIFMAPERQEELDAFNSKSDIWSLGVLAMDCLFGAHWYVQWYQEQPGYAWGAPNSNVALEVDYLIQKFSTIQKDRQWISSLICNTIVYNPFQRWDTFLVQSHLSNL